MVDTNITRYNPRNDFLSLHEAMDRLFEDSFIFPRFASQFGGRGTNAPMNVRETEQGYQVDVSLPGVKPEDIDLTVHQNTLTVRGHYSSQHEQGQQQETQQGQPTWLMREFRTGSFERTVTFPKPIDAEKIETHYEHGLLTISVPLSEASRPKKISIKGGQA